MLISKLNIENGSLIDQVTGLQATIVGSKIKLEQTPDKGFMLTNDGTTGNYVDIPNSTTMTNTGDWSVAIGFNIIETKLLAYGILNKYNIVAGWNIDIEGNLISIRIRNSINAILVTTIPIIKNLHHIILTYNGTSLKTYYNGVLYNTYVSNILTNTLPISLGRFYNNADTYSLKGKIGTPSIFNHALTQKEIDNLYIQWLTPKSNINLLREIESTLSNEYKETGLVAAYSSNLTSDRIYVDKSNNLKNITIISSILNIKNGIEINRNNQYGTVTQIDLGKIHTINMRIMLTTNSNVNLFTNTSTTSRLQFLNGGIYYRINNNATLSFYNNTVYNQWYNISIIRNGQSLTMYSNGVSLGTTTLPVVDNIDLAINKFFDGLVSAVKIQEMLFYTRELTALEIIKFHKKWIKPVLIENFNYGADGVVKEIPNGINTGTWKINELSSITGIAPKKLTYIQCVTNGNRSYPINLNMYYLKGRISFYYYNGTTWSFINGITDTILSTHSSIISYSNNKLTLIGTTGNRFALLKLTTY